MPGKTIDPTAASLDGFIATEDHCRDRLFPPGDPRDGGCERFVAGLLGEIVVSVGPVFGRGQPLLPRRLRPPPPSLRSVRRGGPGLAERRCAVPRLTP